jgi:hypothetical protein
MPAEEVCRKIEVFALRPRAGWYGEFYILPLGFVMDDDLTMRCHRAA